MWVKICANTTLEDARTAAELGADAVGFVFAPSTRQVTPKQVREISFGLPDGVERVGVFGALPADEIAEAAATARLTAVQLHGGYDPALSSRLGELLGTDVRLIQTAHWMVGEDEASAHDVGQRLERIEGGGRVLIDAKVGNVSGGTGRTFRWQNAAGVFASYPSLQLILAGGLRPDNVAEAIQTLQPWGVDVASGVETSPGQKDPRKVREFIENARRA